ncbi:MAG: zinc peptidase [Cyanobacteria bacterium]|nr:zinc peptidase [Cyanobacteriota bacterium]MDA1247062.1 zinc peptidase [Cyanobacteriota bacterium]
MLGLAIAMPAAALVMPALAQPWAPGQEPPPAPPKPAEPAQALALEAMRKDTQGSQEERRRRYLRAAHDLLYRYWASRDKPALLFAGDTAEGCGVTRLEHPMAFYCVPSKQIAMALNLRRTVKSARGKTDQELLLLDLAVLAHEWGHHVNREKGRGPYKGGLEITVKQEELAADWRTGVFLGWLLKSGALGVAEFTQTANLMFEMGDYERISFQHHGYPKDRFEALTRGLTNQLKVGQRLGEWTFDSQETFSRLLLAAPLDQQLGHRRYEVHRFEIDRSKQIATNLLGGLLGAASCAWGSQQECLSMAMEQGKGRALGSYTRRELTLFCSSGSFDVSNDEFGVQPQHRDGKNQATVLARRDCTGN